MNISSFKQRLLPALKTKSPSGDLYLKQQLEEMEKAPVNIQTWSRYRNFWPPTILKALSNKRLIFFMGAGTSAASDLPTWRTLLEERLGLPAEFLADENLKGDNLTLGEITSRLVGREVLQSLLRSYSGDETVRPTGIHYCLATLHLPHYVTTNYDTLFEKAWNEIHGEEIPVICNSSDLKKYAQAEHKLYKIHGSVRRRDEMLVLTRSEYRRHYRSNSAVFDEIKRLIQEHPTVFTGF